MRSEEGVWFFVCRISKSIASITRYTKNQISTFSGNHFAAGAVNRTMKKFTFGCWMLLVFSMLACRKEDQAPGFDMIYQQQFSIPAGIGVFQVHHFYLKNIPTRYEQSLMEHGKTNEDVTGIITAQATLNGIFGDANLNYIDQVSLRVYDEANPNDYVEIAYRQPVPLEPGNSLPLIPSMADFKRFLTGPRCSMDVVFWLRNSTGQETDLRLDLQVKATY